ncbi:MAG: hypothetical protein HN600_01955 [Bacteroidetes bacterium]|nr:hypothetical protein [Bacteroidota bacterium]
MKNSKYINIIFKPLILSLILFQSGCDSSTEPKDCAGESGGSAFIDDCGVCISEDSGLIENYLMDCAGVCGGQSTIDGCGLCDANSSNDWDEDCAGEWGGTAIEDDCGECDDDPSNDCIQDCYGEWGGSALLDNCFVCSGGSTGHIFNSDQDCTDDCFGSAFINACNSCVGGGTGLNDGYCDPLIDVDGYEYETIVIGDQIWMAENLEVTHYRNGDPILGGFNNTEWSQIYLNETGAFAVYNDDPINAAIYGKLYNWYAINDNRDVCPEDWHVPTDGDWVELETHLGISLWEVGDWGERGTNEGSQLAGNADLWGSGALENDENFDTSGFIALPGGIRELSGNYLFMGEVGYFWTSTTNVSRRIYLDDPRISREGDHHESYGFSVRCVKDSD